MHIYLFTSSPKNIAIYNPACRAVLGEEKVKWSEDLPTSANAGVKKE
jgi:hypothetical protein